MKWIPGRQGGGYERLTLLSFKGRMDFHIIRFSEGAKVPMHKDPIPGRKHIRANLYIKKPREGGVFLSTGFLMCLGPLSIFRPDLHEHCLTKVHRGEGIMLSFGIAI